MAPGFRVRPAPPMPDPALVAALGECATSHLADSMGRFQAASRMMVAYHARARTLCGPALTVRTAAGDNLMVQKALDLARPGEVIIVDAGGYPGQAVVGEIMATYAHHRGIAGIVVDGAVRDVDFLRASPLPVFATAVSPRGPSRVGPGEINIPVCVAGLLVAPGDLVVGDSDGVVAVPRGEADDVLAAARALKEREAETLAAIARGQLDRLWIDKALIAGGCEGG